jgi:CheY-like chemotaxis protein
MAKKILIVDDDRINLMLIQTRLQEAGYQVFESYDGEEGLMKAKAEKPDLIILDVEMPKMNGYAFMLEMKKDEYLKRIPTIVLTAHTDMQPIFHRKGIKEYLVKPIMSEQLMEKINKYLSPEETKS